MASEREVLIELISQWDVILTPQRQALGHVTLADAILASDWFAAHDADVEARVRETIAAEIEACRVITAGPQKMHTIGWNTATKRAARIARGASEAT